MKAVNETRTPLQLPGFEKQVVFAAQQALEAWREEALTGERPALRPWCQPLLVASVMVTLRAALQFVVKRALLGILQYTLLPALLKGSACLATHSLSQSSAFSQPL